jgi:hypothetical protein
MQAGILSILYAVAYSTGPIVGGVLVTVSWRWIFGINLPCCALSMILVFLLLRKGTKGPQPPRRLSYLPTELSNELLARAEKNGSFISNFLRIDTIGVLLFITSGILILLGLSWGSTERWDESRVIICFVVGGVLLLLFISWEWMVEHSTDHLVKEFEGSRRDHEAGDQATPSAPTSGLRQGMARFAPKWAYITDAMIPMNMFRSYDVVATNFASMVSGMIMLGIFYFVSVQYVIVQGKSSTSSGVGLLYFAPGMVWTLSIPVYPFTDHLFQGAGVFISVRWLGQPKYIIILSQAIITIAVGFLSKALVKSNEAQIAGFMAMCGVGVGMGFGPLSVHARFSQPDDRVAVVVASNLFFRTAGGTIGLAQLAAVLNAKVRNEITSLIYSGALSLEEMRAIGEKSSSIDSLGGINNLPPAVRQFVKAAFADGLKWAFISLIPWCGIATVLVFFLSTIPEERFMRKT